MFARRSRTVRLRVFMSTLCRHPTLSKEAPWDDPRFHALWSLPGHVTIGQDDEIITLSRSVSGQYSTATQRKRLTAGSTSSAEHVEAEGGIGAAERDADEAKTLEEEEDAADADNADAKLQAAETARATGDGKHPALPATDDDLSEAPLLSPQSPDGDHFALSNAGPTNGETKTAASHAHRRKRGGKKSHRA